MRRVPVHGSGDVRGSLRLLPPVGDRRRRRRGTTRDARRGKATRVHQLRSVPEEIPADGPSGPAAAPAVPVRVQRGVGRGRRVPSLLGLSALGAVRVDVHGTTGTTSSFGEWNLGDVVSSAAEKRRGDRGRRRAAPVGPTLGPHGKEHL